MNALVEAGHTIECVVAQPDKPKGRGKQLVSPATIIRARELGIPTKQPRAVRRGPFVEWMTQSKADVAVVIAYGRILIPELLNAPRLGCINAHASLLPAYRGAAPIHWAVINGETETGVCIMQMDEGMDTGDVLHQESIPINPTDTTPILWGKAVSPQRKTHHRGPRKLEQLTPQHPRTTAMPAMRRFSKSHWGRLTGHGLQTESTISQGEGFSLGRVDVHALFRQLLKIWETEPREGQGTLVQSSRHLPNL